MISVSLQRGKSENEGEYFSLLYGGLNREDRNIRPVSSGPLTRQREDVPGSADAAVARELLTCFAILASALALRALAQGS